MEQNKKTDKLLEVRDLQVSFFTPAGEVKAVNGISYDLNYNEVMGVVGESGSGKSVEAYSIIGLLQNPGKVIGGSITFEGQDVLAKTPAEMVIGFWKIIATSLPRKLTISAGVLASTSWPSKVIDPPNNLTGFCKRPIME